MQIDSTNQRVLMVGDIHQDLTKLKKIINHESPDITVTTGDWFDSFEYDSDENVRHAAVFLLVNRNNPALVSCIGNHDVHYLWADPTLRCSGYEERKDTVITETLGGNFDQVRNSLHWYLWVDDWLVSHAGINAALLPPRIELTKPGITAWLDQAVLQNNLALNNGGSGWFTQAGRSRGGRFKHGGLVWQDFDLDFEPIDGLKQIVGHTPHKKILAPVKFGGTNILDSDNLDIDCHLNQYLIIHNQQLEIKNYRDL